MAQSQRGAPTSQNPGLTNPGFTPGSENPAGGLRFESFGVQEVLQDIMPVLARLQKRAPHTPQPAPSGPLPAEMTAAVALAADMAADSLRRLTAYLDAHAAKFETLENCVPAVTTAAHALAARDYARSFTLIFDVYRTIAVLRAEDPDLPLPASIKPGEMTRSDSGAPDASAPKPAH